jgi:opacity protein-like surface antigen
MFYLLTVFLTTLLIWTGVGLGLPFPASAQPRSTTDDIEAERARRVEAERARDTRTAADTAPSTYRRIPPPDRRYDYEHPGELYVAGFGGYTFAHTFNNVQGVDAGSGTRFPTIDLKNSGVYGAKVGYYLPNRWDWLGFEVEGFNTSPALAQTSTTTGSLLRVTTLAFNIVARAQLGCTRRSETDRTDRDVRNRRPGEPDYRNRDVEFCRLQPYAGVGLGVFFAHASGGPGDSDNAVPGFNGLAGLRYFVTDHIALFGEYKYNRATFTFNNSVVGNPVPLQGDYSASMVVGGLSLHF